ncbi:phosphoribosyltransferase family protein [Herbiconiux sp. CPCC 205763]|uniref:Phosphoribosyltransferase family protein n=1 Tax=Herbiconiux aconitum TaxID=2970913 RepID=A0ABT2GRM0_9MICO|nr:phosphoribosyltransferase family protein [Herbiconiux aconitum]MCS5718872.1 phosphoribosyltransferase family protein [Herbiconiux aconitum]
MDRFRDRRDAGRQLGRMLLPARRADMIVLGLPRGGVIVAAEVAEMLGVPLDVIVVRKLGLPLAPEVAMGAIAEGGVRYLDTALLVHQGVSASDLAGVERVEEQALARRVRLLRRHLGPRSLEGKVAVVVDDGIATGATARVACRAARERGASAVVLAAPVAATSTTSVIEEADEIVSVLTPDPFGAVGLYYGDFRATTDDEVVRALGL